MTVVILNVLGRGFRVQSSQGAGKHQNVENEHVRVNQYLKQTSLRTKTTLSKRRSKRTKLTTGIDKKAK